MLCIQRRKQANFGQSPSGHWEPASSARTTANQGSKCLLEAQSGLNRGWELQNFFFFFYEITKKSTKQSQGELTQVLSTAVVLITLFGFRKALQY